MKIARVGIIGLGYVGLPLAVALSRTVPVVGFDISAARIAELKDGTDRTGEISATLLDDADIAFSTEEDALAGLDAYLITVPTPVDDAHAPDLSVVEAACRMVGAQLRKGAIVVLESTVYPGTVETICAPILEHESGLVAGQDFFLGYSPERINPGDSLHQLGTIVKVVAGQTADVTDALIDLYGAIGPVHRAPDIRTAEAAKVIENAQRDINIAFVNELAMIFHRLDIDSTAVFEAAATKWNFLPFRPGLVGGHCIGVDPYYLTYLAQRTGYHPEVILAGRRINDNMGRYIGTEVARLVRSSGVAARALVLGITFKENVTDIRNSGSADVVRELESFGLEVDVHDPLADASQVREEYGLQLVERPGGGYGAVVLTVGHDVFAAWTEAEIEAITVEGGIVADVRGTWRDKALTGRVRRWQL